MRFSTKIRLIVFIVLVNSLLLISCTVTEPETQIEWSGKLLILTKQDHCSRQSCFKLVLAESTGTVGSPIKVLKETSVLKLNTYATGNNLSDFIRLSPDNRHFVYREANEDKLLVSDQNGTIITQLDASMVINLSFSPDGQYLGYSSPQIQNQINQEISMESQLTEVSAGWGHTTIKIINLKTSAAQTVMENAGADGYLRWTPDSTHIVSSIYSDYFQVKIDGTGQKSETENGWWSPIGQNYIKLNPDQTMLSLYNEHDKLLDIFSWKPFPFGFSVYWSTNGNVAAIVTPDHVGFLEPDTLKLTWLDPINSLWQDTFTPPESILENDYVTFRSNAIWSADGMQFAFVSHGGLFVVDYKAKNVMEIADDVAQDGLITWPAGGDLGFVTQLQDQRKITIFDGNETFFLKPPEENQVVDFITFSQ